MQLYLIDPLLLFGDQQDQQETDDKAKQEEKKKIIRAPLEKHDSEMEIFVNNPATSAIVIHQCWKNAVPPAHHGGNDRSMEILKAKLLDT